jgi:nicotinate-nucleotide adenylyltransferase
MNIGIFGGSFDPIHRGHLTLAQAAASRYSLRQVLFVPANVPPHKQKQPLTAFIHRYAMVALATQDEKRFVPSLLEAPEFATTHIGTVAPGRVGTAAPDCPGERTGAPVKPGVGLMGWRSSPVANYSIDTVRRLKQSLKKSDRLFFLIGMDAFQDVAKWHEARALLGECDFIVASRPGYSLRDVAESLPEGLRPPAAVTGPFHKQPAKGDLVLPGVTLHLLEGVNQSASATAIRAAAAEDKPLARWLDPRVADYIRKHGLYRRGT